MSFPSFHNRKSSIVNRKCLFLLLLLAGCAASREEVRPEKREEAPMLGGEAISNDSAVVLIKRLEVEPLGAGATDARRVLFAWLVTSERLRGFDAGTRPIAGLETSAHIHKEALMLQFLLGGAELMVRTTPGEADLATQQEAGIRSMLAAYRNMIQLDPTLADLFLAQLDEIRRLGELRSYILRKNRAE